MSNGFYGVSCCLAIACAVLSGCSEFVDRETPDAAAADTGGSADTGKNLCLEMVCADDDPCTDDRCDPSTGQCRFDAIPAGVACDDGMFCTVGDTCTDAGCVGEPRECPTSGPCEVGACDEDAADCTTATADDGAACDDGDACTTSETCTAGACGGGTELDCEEPDNPCLAAFCDSATGECSTMPLADTAPCDDDDPCTTQGECVDGTCIGTPVVCDLETGECEVAVCAETGDCVLAPADDGTSCDDGSLCTGSDQCSAGSCAGTPVDCTDAGGPCHVGSCDVGTGNCVTTPKDELSSCDDGNPCTVGSFCASGGCTGGTPVDCTAFDGPCQLGTCNEALGGCKASNLADGLDCDDGDVCTSDDACASGACVGNAVACVAGPCEKAFCDAVTGQCVITADPLLDATACDDGDFCTVDGFCAEGACVTTPRDCSEVAGACQVGECSSAEGACVAVPASLGADCDDDDQCTEDDQCTTQGCAGTPVDCSGFDDVCVVGVCQAATGTCVGKVASAGTPCDDGDACTGPDVCGGGCSGPPVDCSDLSGPCITGSCNPANGLCVTTAAPDGSPCSDGVACTVGDGCLGGACLPGTPDECPCEQPARSVSFDGGCITMPAAPYLTTSHGFTVEFWMRTSSATPARVLDQRITELTGESDWSISYELAGSAAQLRFHYGNVLGNDSKIGMIGVELNDGQWHHIALVRYGTNVQWFIDGEGQLTYPTTTAQPLSNNAPLKVGCGAFGGETFDGQLDELRISNFARYLGDFEPPGRLPVAVGTEALWRFDDDAPGGVVLDAMGQHHGTSSAGLSFVDAPAPGLGACCGDAILSPGEGCEPFVTPEIACSPTCEAEPALRQAAVFDGSGCVMVDAPNLFDDPEQLTVEFWLRAEPGQTAWLFDRRLDIAGGGGFGIRLDPDGRLVFVGYNANSTSVTAVHYTQSPVVDGAWHHVAMVVRPTARVRWYVDGAGGPTQDFGFLAPLQLGSTVAVGCDIEGNSPLVGAMDGVRFTVTPRYAASFDPDTLPAPDDDTRLLLTFDHPWLGGVLLDTSSGAHSAAAGAGVSPSPDAP